MSNEIARTYAVLSVLKKNAKGELSKEKPTVQSYVYEWFASNAVANCETFEVRLLELARLEPEAIIHSYGNEFYVWLVCDFINAIETFVKMYNNGYTVD